MTTNRERFRQLLSENGITQAESAALICEQTQRPCSLRAVRSWLNDPGKASSRECPDWALGALEIAVGRRAEDAAEQVRQVRQQRVAGVRDGFARVFARADPWLAQLNKADLDLARVLRDNARPDASEAALVAAEGFLSTLGALPARG